MKLKNYTVRLCRKDEYDKLISFLHDYWSPNHVFCRNKEIFEFQHGKAENGTYDFVIAVNNETDDIHAVLGFIASSRYFGTSYESTLYSKRIESGLLKQTSRLPFAVLKMKPFEADFMSITFPSSVFTVHSFLEIKQHLVKLLCYHSKLN